MPAKTDISIVICTRDRSAIFAETCDSLFALDAPGVQWEVVVVDNASSDDTRQVALSLQERLPQQVTIADESTVGLSAARNTGIRTARGESIAFLDDDAIPEPHWLVALVEALVIAGAFAVGGPVEPRFCTPLPEWFSDRFLPYLTVWDLGDEPIDLVYNEYPRGANMAFRREAFERFGLFSTDLGRKARSLLSCEETEFCLRIERADEPITYCPGAKVAHRVDGERITPGWLIQRFRSQGASEAIVEWKHAGIAGLRLGSKRSVRRALSSLRAAPTDDGLVRRCEIASARGYLAGALTSPLTIPRYHPPADGGPAKPWLPFA